MPEPQIPSPTILARRWTANRLLVIPILAYAVIVLGYLALRLLGALGLPVTDADGGLLGTLAAMGNAVMPGLLFPSLPLVLLAAALRLPRTAFALLPVGLAFAVIYGPLFIPRPAPAAPAGEPLIVYTHNLHAMTGGLDEVTAGIRASGADLISLQELTEPAAAALGAALAELYPYQELHTVELSTHGGGILSRWPLRETEVWASTALQMRAVVEWPEGDFVFYSLHPPPPHWFLRAFDDSARQAALDSVFERLAQETRPVVLAGDFNLTDQTSEYQQLLAQGLTDSFRAVGVGLGLTFGDFRSTFAPLILLPPFIRIDYVFASAQFVPLEASVGPGTLGSDHYPVRAVLAWSSAAP